MSVSAESPSYGFPFCIGDFEFQKCIGYGTYSTAFLVLSRHYGMYFCAKMTQVTDDFFDERGNPRDPELTALLHLDHPNIIRVYNYFRYDSFFFLILELCQGGCLSNQIEKSHRLSVHTTREYMRSILSALVSCHQMNIAHRDIKPQNIFIDGYGHVKVADFGLSSILKPHQLVTNACGSHSYAAPEIETSVESEFPYDPFKADVWALGVTMYQMLTGSIPWSDEITSAGPERPPVEYPDTLPADAREMISAMLQLNPDDRPTMAELQRFPFMMHHDTPPLPTHVMQTVVHTGANVVDRDSRRHSRPVVGIRILRPALDLVATKRRSSARAVVKKLTFDA